MYSAVRLTQTSATALSHVKAAPDKVFVWLKSSMLSTYLDHTRDCTRGEQPEHHSFALFAKNKLLEPGMGRGGGAGGSQEATN